MMNQSKKTRVQYFDVLNVISCFSVVCLHANGYVHSFDKDNWWWLRVLVEVMCYFAVPVFFMLSGATLMRYRERYSTTDYIRKRFLRVILPYISWGIIFSLLFICSIGISNIDFLNIFSDFMTGNIPYTTSSYWFFIPLFLLYIYIPFLSIMVVKLNNKQLVCLILVMLFFQSFLPTVYSILNLKYSYSLPIGGYFIYALLGYLLSTSNVVKNIKLCRCIYVIAVFTLLLRYVLIYNSDIREPALFTYFGFYAIFPSIAVFLLCKKMLISNRKVANGFAFLAKRSFGIYLIHSFIIILLSHLIEKKHPLFIFSAIIVYATTLLIVLLLQKCKFTRFLVP